MPATELVWRPRKASVAYFTTIGLFIAVAPIIAGIAQHSRGSELSFVIALGAAYVAGLYLTLLRPRIVLRETELEVRNALSTQTIPLADIAEVAVGIWGILVRRNDGPTTTATAVMKLTFRPEWSAQDRQRSERFGRPVMRDGGQRRRADEVVDAIREAAHREATDRTPTPQE